MVAKKYKRKGKEGILILDGVPNESPMSDG